MAGKKTNHSLLKDKGFLPQKQDGFFSLRLRIAGGYVGTDELRAIAGAADRYGDGHVHITSRQGFEIPFVRLENTDRIGIELEEAGVLSGAAGKRVRAIVACQGSEVCKRGLIDSQSISRRIDEMYFGADVPYKFKIAVTGCPSSCLRVQDNDFGIMGAVEPEWIRDKCFRCRLCAKTCKTDSITGEGGLVNFNRQNCMNCGDCISACFRDAIEAGSAGYTIYVGGKVGRNPRPGTKLVELADKETLFSILDRTLEYYRENALVDERLGDVLDRIGIEEFREIVLG